MMGETCAVLISETLTCTVESTCSCLSTRKKTGSKHCVSGKCPVRANADSSLDLTAQPTRGRPRCDECLWFYVLLSRFDPGQQVEEGPS